MSRNSEAFQRRFDDLSRIYADPVEILFKIAAGTIEMGPDFIDEQGEAVYMPVQVSDRRAAASDLCAYRYPKRKALEIADTNGNEGFSFVMLAPGQAAPGNQVKSLPAADKTIPPPSGSSLAAAVGGALSPDHVPAKDEFA